MTSSNEDRDLALATLRELKAALATLQAETRQTPAADRARIDDQVRRLIEIGNAHASVRARLGRPDRFLRGRDLLLVQLDARVRRLEESLGVGPIV